MTATDAATLLPRSTGVFRPPVEWQWQDGEVQALREHKVGVLRLVTYVERLGVM